MRSKAQIERDAVRAARKQFLKALKEDRQGWKNQTLSKNAKQERAKAISKILDQQGDLEDTKGMTDYTLQKKISSERKSDIDQIMDREPKIHKELTANSSDEDTGLEPFLKMEQIKNKEDQELLKQMFGDFTDYKKAISQLDEKDYDDFIGKQISAKDFADILGESIQRRRNSRRNKLNNHRHIKTLKERRIRRYPDKFNEQNDSDIRLHRHLNTDDDRLHRNFNNTDDDRLHRHLNVDDGRLHRHLNVDDKLNTSKKQDEDFKERRIMRHRKNLKEIKLRNNKDQMDEILEQINLLDSKDIQQLMSKKKKSIQDERLYERKNHETPESKQTEQMKQLFKKLEQIQSKEKDNGEFEKLTSSKKDKPEDVDNDEIFDINEPEDVNNDESFDINEPKDMDNDKDFDKEEPENIDHDKDFDEEEPEDVNHDEDFDKEKPEKEPEDIDRDKDFDEEEPEDVDNDLELSKDQLDKITDYITDKIIDNIGNSGILMIKPDDDFMGLQKSLSEEISNNYNILTDQELESFSRKIKNEVIAKESLQQRRLTRMLLAELNGELEPSKRGSGNKGSSKSNEDLLQSKKIKIANKKTKPVKENKQPRRIKHTPKEDLSEKNEKLKKRLSESTTSPITDIDKSLSILLSNDNSELNNIDFVGNKFKSTSLKENKTNSLQDNPTVKLLIEAD